MGFNGARSAGQRQARSLGKVQEMFKLEIRNTRGMGEWAGSPLGWQWKPAVAGTLNSSGESDEASSTFESYDEAADFERNFVWPELPGGWDGEDPRNDGYEIRIREVI